MHVGYWKQIQWKSASLLDIIEIGNQGWISGKISHAICSFTAEISSVDSPIDFFFKSMTFGIVF